MERVIVQPANQKQENRAVLIATVVIVLVAVLLIALRSVEKGPVLKLKYYQLNAVEALNDAELKIFRDLYTSARVEIYNRIKADKDGATPIFPELAVLSRENIAPFVGGRLYKRYGAHEWGEVNLTNKKVFSFAYVGMSGLPAIAGSFLFTATGNYQMDGSLDMVGFKKGEKLGRIWYKPGSAEKPSGLSTAALLKEGWKEVVNLTGKQQRKGK